jgi:hypothetical protein
MERSRREIIFFILVFLVFYLCVKFAHYLLAKSDIKNDLGILLVGLIYTLAIVALYHVASLKSNEEYLL